MTDAWVAENRAKVRLVQDSLLSMSAWANEAKLPEAAREQLLGPYRALLDELYEVDYPLARLVDQSDLLLHIRGPAASSPTPRVSVLTKMLTDTRDQVTRLAKWLGGVTTARVPASLDMGLVGIAGGSLFIGFSTADSGEEGALTTKAVAAIGEASALVSEEASLAQLATEFPDPAERDMAVAAVRRLSPSGQIGIKEIDVFGRNLRKSISLTTDTRRTARKLLAQPAKLENRISFVGTVREVDLDASRFEIRNVEGHPTDIRCAHELDEDEVKHLVDKRVRVSGIPEYGARNVVRLLWVDEVESLD